VNEEWISDKTRFAIDGLLKRRLDRPFIRRDGRLVEASWQDAFAAIAGRLGNLPGNRMAAIAGDLVDVEAMLALKDLMTTLGSPHLECRQDGARTDAASRAGYLFNTTIAGIERADVCLLIGTNPRWEASIVNARLRKRYLMGGFKVAAIGPELDLTFPVVQLGLGPEVLSDLAEGNHTWVEVLQNAKNPMLILGSGALARPDGAAILGLARRLAEACNMVRDDWNGFNVLHRAASRVGGLDIGFVPQPGGRDLEGIFAGCEKGEIEAVWLLGADEIDMSRLGRAFVVYQGHHGDAGARRADIVLPGAAYTEKDGTYVNTEGRVQHGHRSVWPPGEAREDWKILRAFSEAIGRKLPYDSLGQLRQRMAQLNSVFAAVDEVSPAAWGRFGGEGRAEPVPFAYPIADFYFTDPISRASVTMAKCSETYWASRGEEPIKTGTHG
jgi:NADH-quinone oxidoreductase subunit G